MAKSGVQPRALEIEQETGQTDLQLSPFYRREIFRLFDAQVSDEDLRLLHLLLKRQNGQHPTTTSAYYRLTQIYPVYNKYLVEVLRVIAEARLSGDQREAKLGKLPILAKMHNRWSFSNPYELLEKGASMEEYPPEFQSSRQTTNEATGYDNGLATLYKAALHHKFPNGYRKVRVVGSRFSHFQPQDQPDKVANIDHKDKIEEDKLGKNRAGASKKLENTTLSSTTMEGERDTMKDKKTEKRVIGPEDDETIIGDLKEISAEYEESKFETKTQYRARSESAGNSLYFSKYLEIAKCLEECLEHAQSSMRDIRARFVNLNVVTADGPEIQVNHNSYTDLFWGIRGAGHNFGIVTSFEMNISPRGPDTWHYPNYIWTDVPYTQIAAAQGTGLGDPLCTEKHLNHIFSTVHLQVYNATAERKIYNTLHEQAKIHPEFKTANIIHEGYSNKAVHEQPSDGSAFPFRAENHLIGSDLESPRTSSLIKGFETPRQMYGSDEWRIQRLEKLKAKYDPQNRFRFYNPIIVG
ncbi:hypothetical protein F5Y18DRAFT_434195 [Xylariaceae sp. FL1019]|nr:hypothetical protein F5Y18DRAFT_434195 [Xylariaceae sp. FL1019]